MKRFFALFLVLLLLTGCVSPDTTLSSDEEASSTTGDGEISESRGFSLVYNPEKSLNPYTCADYTNKMLFSLLYQGLFSVDSEYNAEPQLCESYTVSKDMKTYVFYLEKATFSDGTLVSANDVWASLEAARNSDVYRGRFTYVDTISITEDGGVQIQLTTAYENLPILLNIPIVKADQTEAACPEGTGPYTLETAKDGSYELRKRKKWWCKASLPFTAQTIPLIAGTDATEIRDEFELGDVGVVCTNPGAASYVDFRSTYDLWDCENGIYLYLGCRAKSSVFSNQAVRQALTYAIDRDTLVRDYYRTFGLAATLPASPNSPYYDKTLAAQYAYAPEKFTAVLEQEEMTGKSISILVNSGDSHRVKVANAIADMLRACSLEVTVKALSGVNYTNALSWGNYDLHLGQTILSPNMDLTVFFSNSGALNYCGMSDTTIAALCKEALANSGNYEMLHQAVMEDGMLCSVAFLSYAVYVRRGLAEDLAPARDNVFYYSLGKTMEDALRSQ